MLTWFGQMARATRRPSRRCVYRPTLECLEQRCLLDAGYSQNGLVSSIPGLTPHVNADLLNPWGFTETDAGQFRVSANASGKAVLLDAEGHTVAKPIIIPAPSDSPQGSLGTPNGQVVNSTSDFVISHGGISAPASNIFSTEDGTIVGWNAKVDKNQGVIGADLSDSGAVFKLLASGTVGAANFLYATDFHNDTVDVFDKNFNLVTLSGSFSDPTIPAGFAPFGIKNIGGVLFVTYAKQDAQAHDDVEGVGNGFIDEFDTSGHFITRFATQGTLNSPIGMAIAPAGFGKFAGALLVGNFGDSRVNAFDLKSHVFLGQLSDAEGNPLTLNGGFKEPDLKGLWGIAFGNGHNGADPNTLFFAAGINAEADGLFGKVTVSPPHGNVQVALDHGDLVLKGDNAGDSIQITVSKGKLRVIGQGGTTINGQAEVDFNGVAAINSLFASLGNGANALALDNLRIQDALVFTGGNGGDRLTLDHDTIRGDVRIHSGSGNDAVSISHTNIGGELKLDTGGGDDMFSLNNSVVGKHHR